VVTEMVGAVDETHLISFKANDALLMPTRIIEGLECLETSSSGVVHFLNGLCRSSDFNRFILHDRPAVIALSDRVGSCFLGFELFDLNFDALDVLKSRH